MRSQSCPSLVQMQSLSTGITSTWRHSDRQTHDDQKLDAAYLLSIIPLLPDPVDVAVRLNDNDYYYVRELKAATVSTLLQIGIRVGVAGSLLNRGTRRSITSRSHSTHERLTHSLTHSPTRSQPVNLAHSLRLGLMYLHLSLSGSCDRGIDRSS